MSQDDSFLYQIPDTRCWSSLIAYDFLRALDRCLSCVQRVSDWKLHNHELNLHVAIN